jgi:hypothetical protein
VGYLAIACRVLVATVFAVSAASKLNGRASFDAFARATERLAGRAGTRVVALVVVALECTVPMLVAYDATAFAGLLVAALLLSAFSVAIVRALHRGAQAPCRCFGRSERPLGRRHLARNGLLIGVALAGVTAESVRDAPLHGGGVVVAVAGGLLTALIVVLLDDVVELFTTMPETPGTRV